MLLWEVGWDGEGTHSTFRYSLVGTSLMVQWFGFCTSNAGGIGLTPGWGTKILPEARKKYKKF